MLDKGRINRKKNILKGARESGLVSGGGGGGSEEREWIVRELGGIEGRGKIWGKLFLIIVSV